MDVTCERCSTAYEFDDALVSERGTTVKCTNCGHQFKVRRPQPVGAPERWLVRTIDGRELEFRALRELQAAIAQAVITRDDVLSRGGSRPRRLGSIAELEPFFVSAGAAGPSQSTSLGLGPRAPVINDSLEARQRSRTRTDPAVARARPSTPQSPGSAAPGEPAYRPPAPSEGGYRPQGPGRNTEVSIAIPLPRGPVPSSAVSPPTPPDPPARPVASPATDPLAPPVASPPTPPDPPARPARPASVPPVSSPPVSRPVPASSNVRGRSSPSSPPAVGALPGVVVAPSGAPPIPPAPPAPVIDEEGIYTDTTRAAPRPLPPAVDDVTSPTAPFQVGTLLDPVRVRAAQQEDWSTEVTNPVEPRPAHISSPRPPKPPPRPPRDSAPALAEPDGEAPVQDQHTASVPPLTPKRHPDSDDLDEPRFSHAPPVSRSGAARWIGGLVAAGMLVLALATVGRKMLVQDSPARSTGGTGESDARIGALLADGEKSLADGDLESAKEQFDKASVLGERDPRANADLARLAVVKADVAWLRVRLLAPGDPDLENARRELDQAAQRARKAADRAGELAPTDLVATRCRVDALRASGDLAGARKLVGPVSAADGQPDNALTLAELDLAEAQPGWASIVSRLRAAVATEGNLGHARSMLIYALARSGDGSGARAELERFGALRPHPLVGALRAYVDRTTSSVDPDKLQDASTKPGAKAAPAPRPTEPGPAPSPAAREVKEPSRERPAPEGHVAPSGPIDVSDLPGVKAPPAPAPPPAATPPPPAATPVPPGVDTSDLPGFK